MPLFGLLMEPCVYGGQPLVRTWHRGNAALTGTSARAARRRARAGLTPRGARRDRYAGGAGSATTRKELAALFAVIGTPSWADVEAVRAGSWRSYLQRLPGRAPTLYRRLAACAGATRGPSCPLRPRTVIFGTLTARSARRMGARLLSSRTRPGPACTPVRAASALVGVCSRGSFDKGCEPGPASRVCSLALPYRCSSGSRAQRRQRKRAGAQASPRCTCWSACSLSTPTGAAAARRRSRTSILRTWRRPTRRSVRRALTLTPNTGLASCDTYGGCAAKCTALGAPGGLFRLCKHGRHRFAARMEHCDSSIMWHLDTRGQGVACLAASAPGWRREHRAQSFWVARGSGRGGGVRARGRRPGDRRRAHRPVRRGRGGRRRCRAQARAHAAGDRRAGARPRRLARRSLLRAAPAGVRRRSWVAERQWCAPVLAGRRACDRVLGLAWQDGVERAGERLRGAPPAKCRAWLHRAPHAAGAAQGLRDALDAVQPPAAKRARASGAGARPGPGAEAARVPSVRWCRHCRCQCAARWLQPGVQALRRPPARPRPGFKALRAVRCAAHCAQF